MNESKHLPNARPVVAFSPENREHRKLYSEFLRTRSWSHCPVRFAVEAPYYDAMSMIKEKLIQFYMHREFRG